MNMLNFVEIAHIAAEIWRFFDFSKMAAVRHLGFVTRVTNPNVFITINIDVFTGCAVAPASPVLTVTGFISMKWQFSTPYRIDTAQPISRLPKNLSQAITSATLMAQTTRACARMCLFVICSHGSSFRGQKTILGRE